jgi:phosphoribosylformimino-5-aminoimidazole carboxamide ribotide isomerase
VNLLPAVDIRDGRAVRLRQGDFAQEQVYADDPLEAARPFVEAGARFLHVVDLDGARRGEPRNLEHLARISSEFAVSVQYGGGLRSAESVRTALDAGAKRVVVGTAAYRDPAFLDEAIAEWGERVAVAVDVRFGRLSVAGWTEETELRPEEAIRRLQDQGVERFVYTNVERDGTLEGPDLEEVRRIADTVEGRFLYSGGVASLDDLRALQSLGAPALAGVISGKALYEGRFTVEEAQELLKDRARVA